MVCFCSLIPILFFFSHCFLCTIVKDTVDGGNHNIPNNKKKYYECGEWGCEYSNILSCFTQLFNSCYLLCNNVSIL
jgi:hypothetical protein